MDEGIVVLKQSVILISNGDIQLVELERELNELFAVSSVRGQ